MWKLLTVTISAFSETWLPLVNYKPDGGFCNLLHLPLMLGQGNLVWTLTLQLVRLINHPIFFFLKSKLLHSLGWSLSHNPSSASQVLRWPLCSTMPSKINKSWDLVVVFSQTNLLSSKIALQPFPLYNKILFKIKVSFDFISSNFKKIWVLGKWQLCNMRTWIWTPSTHHTRYSIERQVSETHWSDSLTNLSAPCSVRDHGTKK